MSTYPGYERRRLLYSPVITAGNIITALSIMLTLMGWGFYLGARLSGIEVKVEAMWQGYTSQRGGK